MNVSVSFSGSVRHDKEVSATTQQKLADRVASIVKTTLEKEAFASGSGTVIVGHMTSSISANTTDSLPETD